MDNRLSQSAFAASLAHLVAAIDCITELPAMSLDRAADKAFVTKNVTRTLSFLAFLDSDGPLIGSLSCDAES